MIQTKQIGSLTQLTATSGYIHKIGTDSYVKSLIMLPSDTIDMYEEVSDIPPYTKYEYDAKVAELVRQRYSESEEFALQRKALNIAFSPETISDNAEKTMEEYAAYNTYVEQCKADAPMAIIEDKKNNEKQMSDERDSVSGD